MSSEYFLNKKDSDGDEEFTVAVVPMGSSPDFYPSDESDYVLIPERIMWRIIGIARAYSLHFSESVSPNGSDRWVYRDSQIQLLEDELEFVYKLVNDESVKENINRIQTILKKALHKSNQLELAFEGP